MTKATALKFARAQARRDVQYARTAALSDLERAVSGYAACRAVVGMDTPIVRPQTLEQAVRTYQQRRGVLFLMKQGGVQRVKVRRAKLAEQTAAQEMRLTLRTFGRLSRGVVAEMAARWCGPAGAAAHRRAS